MTVPFLRSLRFAAGAALLASVSIVGATDPASGTIDSQTTQQIATGGPYVVSNPTLIATGEPVCDAPESCDEYVLTLDLPQSFRDANADAFVNFELTWDNSDDLDLFIYDDAGTVVGQSATGNPAESSAVRISQLPSTARVVIVPFSVTGANATLTMTLGTDGGSPGEPGVDPCVQSGEANQGQAFVDPEVLMDFTILGPQALYGVFVHFNQGSQKWQDGLLTSLGLTVVKDFRKYVPAVYVTGPVAVLQTLITLPAVSRLEYNEPLQYLGATQSWATRARVAHEYVSGGPYFDADGNVLDGAGTTLGVIDSGLYGLHPDFSENLYHNYKLINPADEVTGIPTGTPRYVDIGPVDSESQVGGNGTHVTGTVGGRGLQSDGGYPVPEVAPYIQGTYSGAAPGTQLIHWGNGAGILVLSTASAYVHMLDNLDSFDPPLRAVNNSYGNAGGSEYDPGGVASCLIKDIVDAGVVMAFAAGNDGGDGSNDMTSSACKDPTPGVICVASYNDLGTGDRNAPLSGFSSRGLAGDPVNYPDVAAPGDLITSTCFQSQPSQAICTGGAGGAVEDVWFPWYGTISGTSMATPHVTGIIGLMTQARPDLTPAEIENIIQDTAVKVGTGYEPDPQNPDDTTHFGYGAGLIDVPSILDALGVANTGLPPAGEPFVILDGDAEAGDATDVVTLTMQEDTVDGVTGIVHSLTLGNAADLAGETVIAYRIERNVGGQPFTTTVTLDDTGVTIPEVGDGNTAVASVISLTDNVIDVFVPYVQMGVPAIGEPIHNIRVFVEGAAGTLDIAPSPANSTMATQTMFGRAFTTQLDPGVLPPSDEKSCELPGLTRITSPAGTTGLAESGTGQEDIRQAWIAEPTDMPGKIVFTIKVANLGTQPLPSHRWYYYFNLPEDPTNYWVAMTTDTVTPAFEYGTNATLDTPAAAVGTFTTEGSLDPASNFQPDGTIQLVMDKATLGIDDGTTLTGLAISVRQTTNTVNGVGLTVDSAGTNLDYTLVGNDQCQSPDSQTPPEPGNPTTPDSASGAGGALGLAALGLLLMGAGRRRRSVA